MQLANIPPRNKTDNICKAANVKVPYTSWSSRSIRDVRLMFVPEWEPYVSSSVSPDSLRATKAVGVSVNSVVATLRWGNGTSTSSNGNSSWVEIAVSDLKDIPLSGTVIQLEFNISDDVLVCGVDRDGVVLSVELQLGDAPILPFVQTIVTTGVVGSTVSAGMVGVTSGLVQASIAGKMMDMLRCEFDATDSVDFLNNPMSWAVGRPELQYQRGALLFSIALLWAFMAILLGAVGVFYALRPGEGINGAFLRARLPSFPLAAFLLVGEVCVSPAATALLYGGSEPMDYAIATATVLPLVIYIALFSYQCTFGLQVVIVAGGHETHDPPGEEEEEEENMPNTLQSIVGFLFQPTHHVVALNAKSGRWLQGNFYFVAEKAWAPYGAIEAICGLLIGMLEGVPLTTSSQTSCTGRLAGMGVLLCAMVVALVVKRPFAVRFQQWSSVAVSGTMLIANIVMIVNSLSPEETLENTAAYLILVSSITILINSTVEIVILICSLIPVIRDLLGVKTQSLGQIVDRLGGTTESVTLLQLSAPSEDDEIELMPMGRESNPAVRDGELPHFRIRVDVREEEEEGGLYTPTRSCASATGISDAVNDINLATIDQSAPCGRESRNHTFFIHKIARVDSVSRREAVADVLGITSSGKRDAKDTTDVIIADDVLAAVAAQGGVIVPSNQTRAQLVEEFLADEDGPCEVVVHHHVYGANGVLTATSLCGDPMTELDNHSVSLLPKLFPKRPN